MATKEKKAKKAYVVDGNDQRSAHANAAELRFDFTNGETIHGQLADMPEHVRVCLAWFGLSEKVGNAYAKSTDADDAHDKAVAMYEALKAGIFVAEGKSAGPRISMLAEAIYNAKVNAGQEADMESIAGKLKENEDARKNALNNPAINAEFEALKAKRAAERAEKARAAATGEGGGDLGDF